MTVRYMLDTDISSTIMRDASPHLQNRLRFAPVPSLCVSVITKAELLFGSARSQNKRHDRREVDVYLAQLDVLPWDDAAAEAYAGIRATLERAGTPIGELDTLIAAHALSLNAVLVTNNTRHFARVPRLKVENWMKPN